MNKTLRSLLCYNFLNNDGCRLLLRNKGLYACELTVWYFKALLLMWLFLVLNKGCVLFLNPCGFLFLSLWFLHIFLKLLVRNLQLYDLLILWYILLALLNILTLNHWCIDTANKPIKLIHITIPMLTPFFKTTFKFWIFQCGILLLYLLNGLIITFSITFFFRPLKSSTI
ncbi:hypothetical protein WICPIJ_009462 [Wickerhamomyces pijperi]|uniref:Uncharacterized protein n=1 Tax=Wickerhamomyces pijperi TaxID=599730 RepID=A0A9P8PP57_WICPI|nr:hypothetical protein WICPIJ_009462 [Wickerhamomyces pijperi]